MTSCSFLRARTCMWTSPAATQRRPCSLPSASRRVRSRGSVANDVWIKDMRAKGKPKKTVGTLPPGFVPFVEGKDAIYGLYAWRDKFYVFTNEGAQRFRVFSVDPKRMQRESWKEIVPESDATLDGITTDGLIKSVIETVS